MASLRPPQVPQPADTLRVPLPGTTPGPLRGFNDPMFGVDEAAVARQNAATANQDMMTSTIGAPPPSTYTPPGDLTGPLFTGHAPKATPYGDFTAPDPAALANDPYTQFRLAEGQRGIEHGAAAHGTLLSGGLLRSLERYRQGVASEEAGNAFNRALEAYRTNRDTNAQNFGQSNTQFRGDLDIFGANRRAAPPPTPTPEPVRDTAGPLVYGPTIGDDYITQVQSARDTGMRAPLPAMAPNPFPFRYREARSY